MYIHMDVHLHMCSSITWWESEISMCAHTQNDYIQKLMYTFLMCEGLLQVPGALIVSVQVSGVRVLPSWESPGYGGLELLNLRVHLVYLVLQLLDETVLLLQRVLGLHQLVCRLC